MSEKSQSQEAILLIEDNEDIMKIETMRLKDEGFRVFGATNLSDGLQILGQQSVDIIITDLNLPDSEGLSTFRRLKERVPKLPIVITSGLQDESLATQAVQEGAQDYLMKGEMDSRNLIRVLRYALERSRTQKKLESMNSELAATLERLEKWAFLDPLTESYNRRGFQQILYREIDQSLREGTEIVAMLIDLDDFKRINDNYGHEAGDQVLAKFASSVRENIRETDAFYRYAGDEFLLLLRETGVNEAASFLRKLEAALAKVHFPEYEDVAVSISCGAVTLAGEVRMDAQAWINLADERMYQHKKQLKHEG